MNRSFEEYLNKNSNHQNGTAPADVESLEFIEIEKPIEFPEQVIFGPFEAYIEAQKDRNEVPPEFHYGVLKTFLSSHLGRHIRFPWLDFYLYPNTFTVLVGISGVARKTSALRQGQYVLDQNEDSGLYLIKGINSAEGLQNFFGLPKGCHLGQALPTEEDEDGNLKYINLTGGIAAMGVEPDIIDIMLKQTWPDEGFRIMAWISEFTSVLLKAKSTSTANIPDVLQDLYDFPKATQRNTKSNSVNAPYPCFSMLAASTTDKFRNNMTAENIHAGLANRIEYYINEEPQTLIWPPQPSDQQLMNQVVKDFHEIREHRDHATDFSLTDEAEEYGKPIYEQLRTHYLAKEPSPFTRDALGRADTQWMKNALLFATIRNSEPIITPTDLEDSYELQKYLISTAKYLYGGYHETEDNKIDDRILRHLHKYKDKSRKENTFARIHKYTRIPIPTLEKHLRSMTENNLLGIENTARSTKYLIKS